MRAHPSKTTVTENPLRRNSAYTTAPAASEFSGLSDVVVNELLRERGVSLDNRIKFLRERIEVAFVRQHDSWDFMEYVPFLNVLYINFFKRVPLPRVAASVGVPRHRSIDRSIDRATAPQDANQGHDEQSRPGVSSRSRRALDPRRRPAQCSRSFRR